MALLLLLVTRACANNFAAVDADGLVYRLQGETFTAGAGFTVVTVTQRNPPAGNFSDEFGRMRYRFSSGSLTALATPVWPAGTATKRLRQRTALERIDQLEVQVLVLERWQLEHGAQYDRQAELDQINAQRDALIAALLGP